jgi:EAL domain-containing protein (putative c-di-GMP-specific phosphodiesterase class I)
MNFDMVKLDGSLVASIGDSRVGLPLVRGVLALCREMGQQCVAEHIESERQLELLRGLGCRFGQGFGLSPPVSAAEAAAVRAGGRRDPNPRFESRLPTLAWAAPGPAFRERGVLGCSGIGFT